VVGHDRFALLGSQGVEELDRRILSVMAQNPELPVGLKTIAAAVGESEDTIEEVYEPHLLRLELIRKTPRGRELSESGRRWCLANAKALGDPPGRAAAVQGS